MPSDALFMLMISPFGLVLFGFLAVLPLLFWRLILGKNYSKVGVLPYVTAYTAATLGNLIAQFISSYLEFNDRVSAGTLLEADRWSMVFGWTFYTFVLSLTIILPVLGFIAVPASAVLIRMRRLSLVNISTGLIGSWILLACVIGLFPSNEWEHTHRLEYLLEILQTLLPFFALVFSPFLLSIYITIRLRY